MASDTIVVWILSKLPAKSVIRLKSVCKRWFALASHPVFLQVHTRCSPITVSGLLIQDIAVGPLYSFSVDGGASAVLPDPLLFFVDDPGYVGGRAFRVLQSCNGLLLCRTFTFFPDHQFVLNPTTKRSRQIPNPPTAPYPFKYLFMLAFNPSTSLGYRIACLSSDNNPCLNPVAHVEIYSSETGTWELSRKTVPGGRILSKGVYWNGAVNWLTRYSFFVSFDVEQQVVNTPRMPRRAHRGLLLYFGESRGHLHLIETVPNAGRG